MGKAVVLGVFCLTVLPLAHALYFNTTPATCSNVCESDHCKDPVRLRYGRFCGVGYTGCTGAVSCDGLDACCQQHDDCVGSSNLENYVNTNCSNRLLNCVETWDESNAPQFSGNTCDRDDVVDTISDVMKLITIDGRLNQATIATAIPSSLYMLAVVAFILVFMYQ